MPRDLAQEWVGRTDNSAIPDKVRTRILERQRNDDGVPICPDCGLPLRPGQGIEFDHAIPLEDGGRHAEGNLRAIHRKPCHANKTSAEAAQRANDRSTVRSAYGIKRPPERPLPGTRASGIRKRFNGTVEKW